MVNIVLAFDIYGTLLDTSSISEALGETLGLDSDKAASVSALWRRYQLEYTWRLNSMSFYEPFDTVTKKALIHTLKESQISFDAEIVTRLMDAYNILPCFPDTKSALENLKNLSSAKTVVFSNGTDSMVRSALNAASIQTLPSGVFVADSVQKYKPAPEIYRGLLDSVGKADSPEECYLVSGNPFDVTGALAFGMRAIWIDRQSKGWVDGLLPISDGGLIHPTKIVHSLSEIAEYVRSLAA